MLKANNRGVDVMNIKIITLTLFFVSFSVAAFDIKEGKCYGNKALKNEIAIKVHKIGSETVSIKSSLTPTILTSYNLKQLRDEIKTGITVEVSCEVFKRKIAKSPKKNRKKKNLEKTKVRTFFNYDISLNYPDFNEKYKNDFSCKSEVWHYKYRPDLNEIKSQPWKDPNKKFDGEEHSAECVHKTISEFYVKFFRYDNDEKYIAYSANRNLENENLDFDKMIEKLDSKLMVDGKKRIDNNIGRHNIFYLFLDGKLFMYGENKYNEAGNKKNIGVTRISYDTDLRKIYEENLIKKYQQKIKDELDKKPKVIDF